MMTFSSTTHLRTFSIDGISYMTSSSTSSMVVRRPRAPVLRSSAWRGGGLQRLVGEDQLDIVEGEELLVLLDDRVLRLGQDPHEVVPA